MKAKLKNLKDGLNIKHRKEKHFTGGYKVVNENFEVIIDVRFYWTATRCYCCLWGHSVNYGHCSGSAYAGGYGYDKESAAFANACDAAGIELSENVASVGHSAIERALKAIAESLGYKKFGIIRIYG